VKAWVIVYAETNLLMSVAMGREARGGDLLAIVSPSIRVAIPSGCFMEAFSAFEDEQKRRNWFTGELAKQIGQLRRDMTSTHAQVLLAHLEPARIANGSLLDDVRDRLYRFVSDAASAVELILATKDLLQRSATSIIIPDPTDNLIIHSIVDHAGRHPGVTKALLTDNTHDFATPLAKAALDAAGISKTFRNVANVMGWLGSLTPSEKGNMACNCHDNCQCGGLKRGNWSIKERQAFGSIGLMGGEDSSHSTDH
jgi:hypothetical protein